MKQDTPQPEIPYQEQPELAPAASEPYELQIENLQMEVPEGENVARGWEPWAATDDGFAPPELYAYELDGRRVQGIRAEHRYDVCLIQQVKVIPRLALTFTMNFRVNPGALHTQRVRPEGFVVGVGIDPTGRTFPRSDSVQWALRDLKYGQMVTASVTATVEQELATLFVRSVAFVPGSNTIVTNGSGALCSMICVRTLYARTYLLLPPGASQALWERAARHALPRNWTLGGSADDAGLGVGLLQPTPTVVAINPGAWANPEAPAGLDAGWFSANYPPGVIFSPMLEAQLDP